MSTEATVALAGCSFRLSAIENPCGLPVKARGYCSTHYRKLARLGAFNGSGVSNTKQMTSEAKVWLGTVALDVAKMMVTGARIAARKGDTRPAEWILLHTKTVDPVNKESGSKVERVNVQIGLVLPGLGDIVRQANQSATPVEVSTTSVVDACLLPADTVPAVPETRDQPPAGRSASEREREPRES